MNKTIATTALVLTGLALAGPAHADNHDNFGPGINNANNANFSAAVCFQELAAVPIGSPWNGNNTHHCTNGNVLNHTP